MPNAGGQSSFFTSLAMIGGFRRVHGYWPRTIVLSPHHADVLASEFGSPWAAISGTVEVLRAEDQFRVVGNGADSYSTGPETTPQRAIADIEIAKAWVERLCDFEGTG